MIYNITINHAFNNRDDLADYFGDVMAGLEAYRHEEFPLMFREDQISGKDFTIKKLQND